MIDENLPSLRGDRQRVKQILLNLLTNAVKFTPEGGEVSVKCSQSEDNRIKLIVTDTVIGMTLENREKVLKPFEHNDPSGLRENERSGLGLPLAKKLVEAHGRTLVNESVKSIGTTVTVVFSTERIIS